MPSPVSSTLFFLVTDLFSCSHHACHISAACQMESSDIIFKCELPIKACIYYLCTKTTARPSRVLELSLKLLTPLAEGLTQFPGFLKCQAAINTLNYFVSRAPGNADLFTVVSGSSCLLDYLLS